MPDEIQKVYIVMGNDYPSAVCSSVEKAEAVVTKFKQAVPERYGPHANIYYRYYEMILDDEEEFF